MQVLFWEVIPGSTGRKVDERDREVKEASAAGVISSLL